MSKISPKKTATPTHIIHPFPALFDADSRILILGSFPSVKSREQNYFYGHPQNRFWKLMALLFEKDTGGTPPQTIAEKTALCQSHHIALWDTIHSCDIVGSSDSSITNVVPNDFGKILETADIRQIYCNGKASFNLYQKYCEPVTGRSATALPSTSPANAAWSLDKLYEAWACILEKLV